MYPGWIRYGDFELINHTRLTTHLDSLCIDSRLKAKCACLSADVLLQCDSPPVYDLPDTPGAEAWWYDPLVPESAFAAGIYLESLTGLDNVTTVSDVVQLATGRGSAVTRKRKPGRTLTFTGWLIGKTCCATSALYEAFTAELASEKCGSACGGQGLTFLRCCPDDDSGEDPLRHRRTLHGVSMSGGPQVIQRWGGCCGSCSGAPWMRVTWTMVSDTSEFFSDWLIELDRVSWLSSSCPVVPFQAACPPADDADPVSPCITALPPSLPPETVTTCYKQPCLQGLFFGSYQNTTGSSVAVPLIEIEAGSVELRNFELKAWELRAGKTCPTNPKELGELACTPACGTLRVPWLPANATLTVDHSTRQATVRYASGRTADASALIEGETGAYLWWDVSCVDLCFGASMDWCSVIDNTTGVLTIGFAGRYEVVA